MKDKPVETTLIDGRQTTLFIRRLQLGLGWGFGFKGRISKG